MPVRVTTMVSEWCLLLGLLTGLVWVTGVLPHPAGMVLFPLFVVIGLLAWAVELPLRARLRRQELAMAAGSVATLESPEVAAPAEAASVAAIGTPADEVGTGDPAGRPADVSAEATGEVEPAGQEDGAKVRAAGQADATDPGTTIRGDAAETATRAGTTGFQAPAETAAKVPTDVDDLPPTPATHAADEPKRHEPAPDASSRDASTLEASTPEASTPDPSTPDPSTPDASTPDGTARDETADDDQPQRPALRAGDREMADDWRVEAARALAGEARETAELLRAQAGARRADTTVDGPPSDQDAGDEPRHAEPPDSSRHAQN